MLTYDALIEVARVVEDKEGAIVYSDEDKVVGETFKDPYYKPDYSYSMLLSQNYLSHFSVYKKTDLLMRKEYEGSQDYDYTLRYLRSGIVSGQIKHIPKILYHWRVHDESTAAGAQNKPYAHLSAMRAIKDHIGDMGRVTAGRYPGTYKVDWGKPYLAPLITVFIPTKDNLQYLKTCLFSIEQSTYLYYRVVVIDNGSRDPATKEYLATFDSNKKISVLRYNKPFNFSAINNFAVRGNESDYFVFMNDDTEVITTDWLEQMVQHMYHDNTAVVGPKLLYPNNTIQHAGVIIGVGGVAGHSHKHMPDASPGYFARPHIIQNVSAVTGACMMVSASVFSAVGGFEEELPKAFNDIDLCLKIRALGYQIVYTPYAQLYHHESVSRGTGNCREPEFLEAIRYMEKKWRCSTYSDPYYNPNLTLSDERFSFRGR